jgi:hypothetical protein
MRYSGMDSASTTAGCLLDHANHCGPFAQLTGAYWLDPPREPSETALGPTAPATEDGSRVETG